jgi:outer membrane receptor protein involved in Fe transport
MITRICKTLACGLGAAIFVFLPLSSHAQAVYGSIYGTVTDNTGAVVPNATVTVTDEAKGTSITVQTNDSGAYTAEHLIPDKYDVKVDASGFQSFEAKGIQVFADTSPKVDAQLQVGGASQTITVNAEAIPVLKTDRADVSTEFTTKTITDLPIPDRNFTNIQLLLPGAQPLGWGHAASENPQASKQIQVDGQAFGGVAFQLDGTDNQDPILGIIVINPPLDALSETKITTQNFDAEFGKAVSSFVMAQTKSGSNNFHGSIYDYRESNANLARDPYTQFAPDPVTGHFLPPGLKNQFGGTLGGPILKDRLFFFGDYEGVRQKVGISQTATVPTKMLVATCLGQQTGPSGIPGCDFSEYAAARGTSQLIYDNSGGTSIAFPGNVIPTSRLSPQSLALLKLLQPYAPNTSGVLNGTKNNYAASGTGGFNSDQWGQRVDWQASSKTHVFERFSRFTDTLTGKPMFGAAGGAGFGLQGYGGTSKGANDSLAAGVDIAISPTVLTDFRVGYYRYNIVTAKYDQGTDFATQLGIPGLNTGSAFTSGAPAFNIADTDIAGNKTASNGQSQGPQYGSGLNINRCNCPLTEKEDQFQIVNNWTKIIGNHSFKFGADLRYARNLRVPSDTNRAGELRFDPGPTSNGGVTEGLGFATFVLGDVTNFGRYVSVSTNAKEFQKRFFFYGQDTWRVTPNLTLNLGVRYELYYPESVNAKGNGALMNLKDGYLRVAGYGNVPSNMGWSPATNAWNPRVGFAYQLDPKTVIRAGYGRSFDIGVFGSIFGHVVTQNLPVLANQSISQPNTTTPAFNLSTGPAPNVFPSVPSNGLLPAPGYAVSPKARPNSLRLPTLDAWNLSIQHSLTPTLSFTLAYIGNKGTHTLSAGDGNNTNPNEAGIFLPSQYSIEGRTLHYKPQNLMVSPDSNNIDPDGGTPDPLKLSRYYGGTLPACQDPAYKTPTGEQGIMPGMCGWTNGISYYGDDQDTEFNALQASLAKQFTHGLSFNVNYAWQRGYNFNSGYATWSRTAVKGRDDSIREQQIIGYGNWQLPFGRNQWIGSNVPRVVDEIIGGWQFSPVITWSTGLPFTVGYSNCGESIPGSAPCYPNGKAGYIKTHLTGFNAQSHTRTFFSGVTCTGTNGLEPGKPCGQFTAPGLDQIGNMGRNSVFGPHFFNADLSLQKNFPIYESLLAQFRVDAFNGFNHINAGNPGQTNIDGGAFTITNEPALNVYTNPRQLQFSLRLQF